MVYSTGERDGMSGGCRGRWQAEKRSSIESGELDSQLMSALLVLSLHVSVGLQMATAPAIDATLTVSSAVQATLSGAMNGAGMEELNHEIYGGVYDQLIHGESFEEPAGKSGVSGDGFLNINNPGARKDPVRC